MKKLLLASAIFMALSTSAMAKEYTVKMVTNPDAEKPFYFEPDKLTVQIGDTVTWVNVQEGGGHSVMAESVPKGADNFDSPILIKKGASYSVTFDKEEGTYEYHCHPHSSMGMTGVIIVGKTSIPKGMKSMERLEGHNNNMPGKMKHSHGKHNH